MYAVFIYSINISEVCKGAHACDCVHDRHAKYYFIIFLLLCYQFTHVPLSALVWEQGLGISAPRCVSLQAPWLCAWAGCSSALLLAGRFSLGLLIQGNLLA